MMTVVDAWVQCQWWYKLVKYLIFIHENILSYSHIFTGLHFNINLTL
jgi:hypothetical protein